MKYAFGVAALCALLASPAQAFDAHSKDFRDGGTLPAQQVYRGFGCEGGNRAPQLVWTDPPAGTKSYVITAYDPDAPTGSGWWHWVVYDLPADVHALDDGAAIRVPGRQGRNDFGTREFGGACPPVGDKPHRYIFTVHALKVAKLDVPDDASPALIGFMVHMNTLGSAKITATYSR